MRALARLAARLAFAALAFAGTPPALAQTNITVNATNDLTCAGVRGATGCTAGEFTTIVQLSNPSPLNCVAGQYVFLSAVVQLSGTNANRFNVGWFTGQDGNDPRVTSGACSAATMPTSPAPWFQGTGGNTCGDYTAGGVSNVTVNNMKILCQGDATGNLQVPYTLIYSQNDSGICTGPADVQAGSSSKCNAGTAILPVSTFSVLGGITVTKNTLPAGNAQTFNFTATSADPTNHPLQPGSGSFTLGDTQSKQVQMQINGTATNLTISEASVTGWDPTSTITCTKPDGSSAAAFVTINNATRTITASLSNTNPLANCTVVNTKQPTLTLTKVSNGTTAGYTFSGNNGWANQTITTATSGVGVAGATQTLSKASTATTLTETLATGEVLQTATCTGMNGGTVTPGANGTLALDATAMGPGNNVACTVNNTILPKLTKAFNPTVVAASQASTLTFTIANVAGALAQTGVGFTDAFPANLVIAATPNATTTCGGSPVYSAVAGAGTFSVSGLNVAAGASSCTVSVDVSSATPATYTNGAAQISGLANLFNNVTNQTLVVQQAPSVTKSFAVANLASGGNTNLTVTLGNPNAAAITLTSAFTDTFPAGMTINTAGSTGTCAGVSATAGAGSFTVANGTSIPSGGCTVVVNVTSTTAGAAVNSIPANTLQTSAGNGTAAASATLNVYVPPTVTKTFAPGAIASGATSSMTIVVSNPAANPGNLTGVAVSDTYGGTLKNNAAGSVACTAGGSATLSGGVNNGTTVGFTAGTIPPGGSCTITQSVTATTTNNNTTSTPAATGPVALTGATASATLTILTPPTLAKAFNVTDIATGGNTSLTVTLGNPNAVAITLSSALTDTFPAGMTIGTAGNSGTCGGVTATAGAASFTVASGTSIPAGGCTVVVNIVASTTGARTNTLAAGALATNGGANAAAASATLNAYTAPTISKAFGTGTLAFNATTTLTLTITNPAANPNPLTGLAVSDPFPAGLQVAAAPGLANTCGGTVNPGATAGDTTLTLAGGGPLAAGASCTITVNVTGTSAGVKNNTTGAVSATGPVSLTGSGSNTAALTVQAAPTVAKAFGVANLASGGNTSLTVTLGNTNAAAITLTSLFTDSFPAGMTINTAGNTGTCAGVTAAAGAGSFTIANGTSIPAGGCTVIVNVKSSTAGAAANTIAAGALATSAGSNTAAASATLNVYAPPTVSKTFTPNAIASGGTSTLSIVVSNPAGNPGSLTGVAVNDAYTGTLANNAAGSVSCTGGGAATLTGGANGGTAVGFNAGTIPAGSSCTITQSVTATSTNTNATNAPTATGPVALTGTAASGVVLTVLAPPTVAKAFASGNIAAGGNTNLMVTLGNTNAIALSLTSALTDTFPAGMTINTAGNTGTCAGVTANAGAGSFTVANGSSIPAGGCTVIVNVTSSTAGAATNTIPAGALQTSGGNNAAAASATLAVFTAPTVTKTFTPNAIASGGTSTLTIVVSNPAANPASLTGVVVSDTYIGTLKNNAAGSVSCTAGGSATLTGGANNGTTVGFNAGTIPAGGTCTITQSVTATSTNTNATTAPASTGPVALTGTAATGVVLTVLNAPTVAKTFGVANIATGANTSLTVTVGNTNASAITLTSLFTDAFPAGMTLNTAGNTGTCAGVTASAGAGSFTIANGTSIPAGGCTVVVDVTSSTAGGATNTIAANALQTSGGNNAAAASATLNVYAAPTIAKAFGAGAIAFNGTTTLTLTLTNPAANPGAVSGLAVSDAFPAGLQVAAVPGLANTCGGTVNPGATAGDTALTLSGGAALAAGASCTITVNVTGTTAGVKNNTTGALTATGPAALTGTPSNTATVTVSTAPTLAKAFGVANLASGGNTSLTVTLGNTNAGAITLTSALTDTFPAGMTINTAGNTGTCAGVTANAGAGSFTIANGTSIPSGGCTVIVNVTSSTAGTATNTLAAGALQTSAGTNGSAASASLNVYAPPTIAKAFGAPSILLNGSTTLTLTITNPAANPGPVSGLAVSDAFPAGLQVAAVPGFTSTCGGTVNPGQTAGDTTLTLSAGSALAAGASCAITVSVTGTTSGIKNNTTGAVGATAPVALTGGTANATLTVAGPPTVTKAFATGNIAAGANTNLTVTLGNTNAAAITLSSAFTDTFPAGMTINTAGNSGTCAGVTASAAAGSFSIANGTSIPAGGCTVIVNVTSSSAGAATNSIAANALQTSAGSNAAAASATLNVYTPPTVTKTFTPNAIASGGSSTLTIVVSNPAANPGALSGVAVGDTYTGTLKNNAAGSVSCTGGGSATLTGGANNGTTVGFNAGTIPPGASCTITQGVTATSTNTNATSAPTTTGPVALTGTAATGVVLTILGAPTVTKSFAAPSIAAGGNTNLTVTIGNTNASAITLTSALTDTFPAGMTINTAGNTGTCAGVTASAGASSFTVANGTSIPSGGCTVVVNVTSSTAGAATNTIAANALQTSGGNNGASASATLDVYVPPTIAKAFGAPTIGVNAATTLTLTITNPAANPGAISSLAVSDAFPAGLQVAAVPGVANACGGTVNPGATAGDTTLTLAGGAALAAGASCTITVSVTGTTAGAKNNTTGAVSATGPVTLTGTTSNTATLTVQSAPTLAKAFGAASLAAGGNTSLTVTLGNPNAGAITLTSAFTDTFPAGMTINTAGNTGTCAGVTANAGAGSFTVANGTSIPAGGCTVIVNVTSSTAGTAANTLAAGSLQASSGSNAAAASASIDVYAPPTVTKTFTPPSIASGGTTTLTIVVSNPAANPGALTGVAVSDTYTGTLRNSAAGSVSCTAGGSATLTGGANNGTTVGFNAGTIPAGGTCTITQGVTATTNNTNATSAPTATGPVALTGTAATGVVLTILGTPTVTKSFAAPSIAAGGNTNLTVTIGNTNAGAITLTSAFTDTFPAGMTINTAGNSGTCAGVTASAGAGGFTIANGTSIAAGGCTVVVNVTSSTAGAATNTIAAGALQTSAGSNAASTSATLNVHAAPTVTKTFTPSSIASGGTSTLTIVVTNPAANPANLTGVAVGDTYTGTLKNNAAGTVSCTAGGSATLTGGASNGTTVGFNAGTIPAGGSCTITQSVTATTTNTNATSTPTATGPVALTGTAATGVVLTILGAPTVTKVFASGNIAAGGNTNLTVTLGNTNASAITLTSAFTDTFPAGMTINTAGNSGTCAGVTATAGGNNFTLANGASIPAGGCTVVVNVTSSTAGAATNTIPAGALQTSGGNNAVAASGTLDVYAPPTIAKAFGAATVAVNGTTTLTLSITNPAANPGAISGLAVSDVFPAGLQAAAVPGVANTCGGTVNPGNTAGDTTLTLAGGAALAAGASCTITLNVTGTAAGAKNNTTGAVSATGPVALTGAGSNTAILTVQSGPTVTKTFGAASLASGGSTSLTVTLGNPNAGAITLTSAFTDSFPAGMTINTAGNTGTCAGVTANAGAASFTVANGTSIAGGGCTVIVSVTSSTAGAATNTVAAGSLQTSAGSNAAAASASLDVYAPPTVTKTFTPPSIASAGTSTLTIVVSNPAANPGSITGVAVNDAYTGTLANNAAGTVSCTAGGSATLTGGTNGGTAVGFNAGTISAGGSCTITQSVTATTNNTNATSAPTATGPVALTGSAATGVVLTILGAPTVTKSFAAPNIAVGASTNLTVTIGNGNAGAITLTSAFTDAFPAGMTINGAGNTGTCSGVTAAAGAGSFTIANGTSIPAGGCTVIVNVTSGTAGAATNTVAANALQTSAGSNASPASATLNVYAAPTVTKTFTPSSIASGSTSILTIVVGNPAANPGNLTGVAVNDAYTGTLQNNAAGSVSCTGGGSATLTGGASNGTAVGFNAGNIPPGATCTITQSVTATTTNTNATSTPTATGPVALTGTAATGVVLTILNAPTVAKSFAAGNLAVGGNTDLTVTLGNTNASAITLTSAFTDTFPAGMTVNTAGNAGTCAGVTATAGAGSFSIANGTSIPAGGCTIVVNVASSTAGAATNSIPAGALTTSGGNNAAAASATLGVFTAPTVAKSFAPSTIGPGGTSTLTIVVTNPAANPASLTGVSIADTYGGTLANAAAGSVACTGGGSATLTGGANGGTTAGFNAGTIPPGATCTITQQVAATSTSVNTTGAVAATGPVALTGGTASATLTVSQGTLTKSFAPATIAANGTSTLTFTIANTAGNPAQSGINFSDALPAGLSVAGTPNVTTNCPAGAGFGAPGFSVTAAGGGIAVSGASLGAGVASCQVKVDVTAALGGTYTNDASNMSALAHVNNAVTPSTLTVTAVAPSVAKAFSASPVNANAASTLTITLTNANNTAASLTAALVDTLPSGLVVAATPNAATTCAGAGAVIAAAGASSITLPATRSVPAGSGVTAGSCTISVDVSSPIGGAYTNTIAAGALQTSNGNNASAASANLTVNAVAPTLAKSFSPTSMAANGTSTVTLTLTNANNTPASLAAALTDSLPANLAIAATPNASTTCAGSGPVNATAGAGSASLPATRAIPAASGTTPGSCTVTFDVTTAIGGAYTNTIAAGALQTSNGNNAAAASATLTVTAPAPTVSKSFSPTTIALGGTSTLTLTFSNANTSAASLTAVLSDALPAGMVVAATPNASTTCPGSGAVGAAAFASSITLPATRAIPAGSGGTPGSCTVTVDVTSTLAGMATNTIAAGALQTSNGNNAAAASAQLTVTGSAPTATKSFAPPIIAPNGTSVLTIVVTNPNAGAALTGVAFTDNYPAGLVNTGTPSAAISGAGCAGTLGAAGGAASFTLTGGTVPASGSCTYTVNVTVTAPGAYLNSTGAIATSNGVTGSSASGTLNAFAAPTVTKSFAPSAIPVGGTATLTITVTNPAANPAAITATAIADAYPAGLTNAAAGSVSCTSGSATLTGGANAGTSVGFNAATVPPGATCTITQPVTSNTPVTNTTSTATSNEAPAGTAASASLAVASPPSINKAFTASTVPLGGSTTLTFTITNPNTFVLTGAAFSDTLSGMVIDAASTAGGTCAGAGGNSFTANQANLAFSGLSVPASLSCTVTVVIRGTTPGVNPNTTSGVSSNQTSTGAASNTANLTVTATAPTVAKAFSPATIDPGATSTLTVTIGNGNGAAITVTSVTDTFPAGLATAATPNASTTCAGGAVGTAAGGATLTGGTVPANGSCTFQVDVTSSSSGAALNNTIGVGALTTSVGANAVAANATLNVRPSADVAVTKTGPATIVNGGAVTYTIVVSNSGPQAASGALFSDNVPAMVTGVAASCGSATGGAACGTVNVAGNAVTSTITTLPSGGSVTFTVSGTAPQGGTFTNTAQALAPAGVTDPTDPARSGAGNNSASVNTTVIAPDLRLTKSHSGGFVVGTNRVYTLTVDNTLGGAATSGTITVTDTLPTGLTYVSAAGTGWSCGAAAQVVTCTSSTAIAAGATGAAITLTVAVGPTAMPSVTNSASVSGGGEPAAANGNNNAFDPTLVTAAPVNTFAPDNSQSGAPGTTLFYAHTYQAGTAGSVTFSTSAVPVPSITGWSEVIFRDTDCNGVLNGTESSAPLTGAVAVNAGDTVCIIVRESIPATAPYNAQDVVSVTATPSTGSAITRTDTTTVGATAGSGLTLAKTVRNVTQGGTPGTANTAKPNDILEYTITFTNTSSGTVSAIVVTDATPAFTLYQSAQCGAPLPPSLTGCGVTSQPAVNGSGSIVWTLTGTLLSGGSGAVSYQVRVSP